MDNQGREHQTSLKNTFDFKIDKDYKFYNQSFYFKFWNFMHRLSALCFLKPYISMKHSVKIKGKENLKDIKNKGAVVISNHIDVLDIQMIALYLFGIRKYNWLTLEKNFCLSVHWMLRNSGAIPIPTDDEYREKFFKDINDILKNKGLIHICPEGSLQENSKNIRPFKIGAFRFSYDSNVPIVPVTILKSTSKRGKVKYTLNIDKPQYPDVTQPKKEEIDRLKTICQNIMQNNCDNFYSEKSQLLNNYLKK